MYKYIKLILINLIIVSFFYYLQNLLSRHQQRCVILVIQSA